MRKGLMARWPMAAQSLTCDAQGQTGALAAPRDRVRYAGTDWRTGRAEDCRAMRREFMAHWPRRVLSERWWSSEPSTSQASFLSGQNKNRNYVCT